jgi:uncharacterized membrane protein/uncharacterized membrane protein YeaQ/YmgE (transglycosylase-associated protein family)
MHTLAWIVSGMLAGALVGRSLRGSGYGFSGSLLIGTAGGIVGGWFFNRAFGISTTATLGSHFIASLLGGAALVLAVRALDRAAPALGRQAADRLTGPDIEGALHKLGELERKVYTRLLKREPVAADANAAFDAGSTFGQRVADKVAAFGGSWTFIGIFCLFMAAWMVVNQRGSRPVDPFPFILLNLMLSCLAALQAPVIMMSQNRQSAKDRLAAENDFRVNLNAEMQIMRLHERFEQLEQRLASVLETRPLDVGATDQGEPLDAGDDGGFRSNT